MIELKCKSCGGNLEIDEDKEFGTCSYCKAKYKINEDQKVLFSMDENTKETIQQGYKLFGKISLTFIIPFLIVAIVAIGIIVFIIMNMKNGFKSSNDITKRSESSIRQASNNIEINMDNMISMQKEMAQNSNIEFERNSFNGKIEIYSGTNMGGNVKALIDTVVTNNKTKDRKITIKYNEIETTNSDDLIELKGEINDFDNYEVILNYDNDNYICEAIIENAN